MTGEASPNEKATELRMSDTTTSTGSSTSDRYITPGEAARILHVSPKTINRWANEGLLPCIVTLGGHRRFRRQDVDAEVSEMSARGAALNDPSEFAS
jgi:excisionase family DNA binding protein